MASSTCSMSLTAKPFTATRSAVRSPRVAHRALVCKATQQHKSFPKQVSEAIT